MLFEPPGSSLEHVGRCEDTTGMLRKSAGDAPGAPGEVPGNYSESSGEALGSSGPSFWSFLVGKSRLPSGNVEMLENDDPLLMKMLSFGGQEAKMGAGQLVSRSAVDGRV